jgi:hypothetical protein
MVASGRCISNFACNVTRPSELPPTVAGRAARPRVQLPGLARHHRMVAAAANATLRSLGQGKRESATGSFGTSSFARWPREEKRMAESAGKFLAELIIKLGPHYRNILCSLTLYANLTSLQPTSHGGDPHRQKQRPAAEDVTAATGRLEGETVNICKRSAPVQSANSSQQPHPSYCIES